MLYRRALGCCSVVVLSLLMSACQGLGGGSSPTPTPTPLAGSLNSINHIVLFMQENRSFDTYFGQLNAFRAKQTPALPQEVDTWSSGADKTPTNVSTPSYDPNTGLPGPPIKAFHMQSACSENLTPSWNETHRIWDLFRTPGAFPMAAMRAAVEQSEAITPEC